MGARACDDSPAADDAHLELCGDVVALQLAGPSDRRVASLALHLADVLVVSLRRADFGERDERCATAAVAALRALAAEASNLADDARSPRTLLVALEEAPDDERECDAFVAEAERALRPAVGADAAAVQMRFVALPSRARSASLYDTCAHAARSTLDVRRYAAARARAAA